MPGLNKTAHRIRLRGPWLLEQEGNSDTPRTVRLPLLWGELFDCGPGRLRLNRRFNRPTNLGLDDRVSIVIYDLPTGASVGLNGETLPQQSGETPGASTFETTHLEPSNLLTVEFDVPTGHVARDAAWGEVVLMISSS